MRACGASFRGGACSLFRSFLMLLFLAHFLKTGVFSFTPPRVYPQSTSPTGRFVQVFGRRLAPEAMPQAASRVATSEEAKTLSSTFTGRQSATPSHQLYGSVGLMSQKSWQRPVPPEASAVGTLTQSQIGSFSLRFHDTFCWLDVWVGHATTEPPKVKLTRHWYTNVPRRETTYSRCTVSTVGLPKLTDHEARLVYPACG